MLDPDVKIIKQAEDGRYNLDGERTAYIRVEFYVGKHGPFVERFPKDSYTAAVRDQRLTDFAREVRA
jgi:hypothetical protein